MADVSARQATPEKPPAGNGRAADGAEDAAGAGSDVAGPGWLKPLILAGLAVLVLGAVWVGVRYLRFGASHTSTDNAYLTADVIQIAPQVSGTVVRVYVQDNQLVKAGDPLVALDDATYRSAVQQAEANLAAAIAQARGADASVSLTAATGSAQVAQAQGVIQQAESGIASAAADVARAAAAVTNASATASGAQAAVGTAQGALGVAIANKQRARDAIASAEAQVETARASVRAAQAAADAARVAADKAGRDAKRYATLVAQGAVSEQVADQASSTAASATAQLEAARQQVAQAQAVVTSRVADANAAKQQLGAADAAIAQARAQVRTSQQQALAAKAGVGQSEAARRVAEQAVHSAEARKEQAAGQLAQAETAPRQVDVSRSAQAQAAAKIAQARAALEAARIQLGYTRIAAPTAGRVSKKTVEVGALVSPGTPLMALVPTDRISVVAVSLKKQLPGVQPGQPAEIEVDAVPGRTFRGRVDSVAAATSATFALLPPDNATGNFTKVVQRIPVKITLDPNQPGLDRLRAGMSVTATIRTR